MGANELDCVVTDLCRQIREGKDEITRLREENARLREALERIANPHNWDDDGWWAADSHPNDIAEEALNRQIYDDNETRLSRPFSGENER